MRKGFAEEILSFSLIIFSVIILTIFFASESVLKGGEVTRSVRGRMLDESANLALQTIYDHRLERFEKTYMELILDAQLQGNNETHVYYGRGSGVVHVKEILNPMMNSYFGKGGWKLVVKNRKGNITYGNQQRDFDYKYISNIPILPPVSEKNIGNVTLHV
ncbi:MAG: hypothetical protein ABEK17_04580 [Candidatus Aenigmatarchaeota archaeon]